MLKKASFLATLFKGGRRALVVVVLGLALIGFLRDADPVRRACLRMATHPLHAKTFVVDGEWFTVGSMNFDNRSMALNDEATMVLDRTLGDEMHDVS